MKAIHIGTDGNPTVIDIEDILENWQFLVKGNIEVICLHEDDANRCIDLIVNEEYRFLYEDINKILVYPNGITDDLRGNIACVATDMSTGEFCSLTDEEISSLLPFFQNRRLVIK